MITASATTGAKEATAGGCVITLNPTASGAIDNNGTTDLTTGCGVFVNSSSSSAINLVGGGIIRTTGTAKTEIVGNWNGSGTITPAPVINQPYQGDPMADLEPPAIGSCTDNGVNLGSHQSKPLKPGVYCGGIYLGAQSSVTLDPGLYIVKNGISLGGQTSMSGDGVTIYIESGGVIMSGGATVGLTAPSSGPWQGILFFQARGNANPSTLVGGTNQQMNGALYFPSAQLTYSGGSSVVATATTIIADTLRLNGSSYISVGEYPVFGDPGWGLAHPVRITQGASLAAARCGEGAGPLQRWRDGSRPVDTRGRGRRHTRRGSTRTR